MRLTIKTALAAFIALSASAGAAAAGDDIYTTRFSNAAAGG